MTSKFRVWGDEVTSTEGPTCPYCHNMITPDEGHYYDVYRYTEDECSECSKTFDVTEVDITTTWTTKKRDEP